jgi:spermidine synthase
MFIRRLIVSATSVAPAEPCDDLPRFCQTRPTLALFAISVPSLFLEIMLIRWIGTEIRIFAYLQNTILVVCFLGLGLGCFWSRRPIRLTRVLAPLGILSLLLAIPVTRSFLQRLPDWLGILAHNVGWFGFDSDQPFINGAWACVALVAVFALMVLISFAFVPLGQILGRLMDAHPHPIAAYSANVVGSLLGVWLFAAASLNYLPPLVWMALAMVGLLPFVVASTRDRALNFGLMLAVVGLAWLAGRDPSARLLYWSPYQKLALTVETRTYQEETREIDWLKVNNTGYQMIVDLRPETLDQYPDFFPEEQRGYSQYDIPHLLHRSPRNVLIVGAGSGNDAAGCLRHGAEQVTAVEIDPAIIEIGKKQHPERPYFSPRVKVVIDDARAYFATSTERFDLIIFGLLDSHTMTSMTNARLDHFVYTRESIQQAHRLLKDDGLMVLSFEAQKDYIVNRLALTLHNEFGKRPLVFQVPHNFYGFGGVMFVAGNQEMAYEQLARQPHLNDLVKSWQARWSPDSPLLTYQAEVTTDDWPYIYLESRSIPAIFFLIAAMIFLLLLTIRRILAFPPLVSQWSQTHSHFAFLGAAFMLLEVQNISAASAVLGNTWLVNAVIISGVLVMILLANLLVAWRPALSQSWVSLGLCGVCLGLYFVNLAWFAAYPPVLRAIIVGALTTLPMFFSGIVFIRSYQAAPHKDEALGANLIGSLVGALLQSITYLTGMRVLLLLVTGLYVLAIWTRPKAVPAAASEPLRTEPLLPLHA